MKIHRLEDGHYVRLWSTDLEAVWSEADRLTRIDAHWVESLGGFFVLFYDAHDDIQAARLYDPETEVWEPLALPPELDFSRRGGPSVEGSGDHVILFGLEHDAEPVVYHPDTGCFQRLTATPPEEARLRRYAGTLVREPDWRFDPRYELHE